VTDRAVEGSYAPIRVMTWNIHGCVGTDFRRDPERIARAIGSVAPDILALQEIDIRARHRDAVPLLDRIADEAGGHRHVSYSIDHKSRSYGIALFSRWPIHSERWYDLACGRREPRRAIEAVVETPAGPVRVIATHFGLSPAERDAQIARLQKAIRSPVEGPTILLGDFNDWRRPGAVGRLFGPDFPTVIAPRTFPSHLPILPLDRIFVSAHLTARLLATKIPPVASDHRALAAEVMTAG
jgi:endonuclease/exonuclease/phosphatase family metal-dependent hydrolase